MNKPTGIFLMSIGLSAQTFKQFSKLKHDFALPIQAVYEYIGIPSLKKGWNPLLFYGSR
jgi:hypothetical protein